MRLMHRFSAPWLLDTAAGRCMICFCNTLSLFHSALRLMLSIHSPSIWLFLSISFCVTCSICHSFCSAWDELSMLHDSIVSLVCIKRQEISTQCNKKKHSHTHTYTQTHSHIDRAKEMVNDTKSPPKKVQLWHVCRNVTVWCHFHDFIIVIARSFKRSGKEER